MEGNHARYCFRHRKSQPLCASIFLTHKVEVILPRAVGRINIFNRGRIAPLSTPWQDTDGTLTRMYCSSETMSEGTGYRDVSRVKGTIEG